MMNDKPVYKNELTDTYIYTAANGNWYISEQRGSESAWISSGGSICPYKVNLSTKKWKHYTINDGWYELLGFQILPGRRKFDKPIRESIKNYYLKIQKIGGLKRRLSGQQKRQLTGRLHQVWNLFIKFSRPVLVSLLNNIIYTYYLNW